jgi:Bifunctional DNA primase/polymerase, N-terminal
MSTSLPNALGYAWQGIPVFPCDPNDKTPCCMRGFHAATTDENQIRTWWLQY